MIKYLGSKRLLVPRIVEVIEALGAERTVLDLFSGTSRVGHALKAAGHRVHANDLSAYGEVLARCYVAADRDDVWADAERLLDELGRLPGRPGYVTDTFCTRSRFFHPKNGERIDAIRDVIAAKALPPELEAVVLTSLMEAADRVDSTVGVQMAYLKAWAPRALHDLQLRMPTVLAQARAGKGSAHRLDAAQAADRLTGDVAYLDPPYNQHKYTGNYHIWETLVRWDAPDTYGVACKRQDVRTSQSPYNRKHQIGPALADLVARVQAPVLLVSFSDEGFLGHDALVTLLGARGHVTVLSQAHPRYVGARIGIFDPSGRKVGTVGALTNREHLFLVTPEAPTQALRERLGVSDATGATVPA